MSERQSDQDSSTKTVSALNSITQSLELPLSRRSLLVRGATLGLAVPAIAGLLAACGDDSDDGDDDAAGASDSDDESDDAGASTDEAEESEDEDDAGDDEEPVDEADDSADEEEADAGEGASGGTLIFNGGSNPTDMDPQTTGETVTWYFLDNIFDRLVRLDDDGGVPEPSLAEDIDISDDGLQFTFKLREGVLFHNGRELVADDVKFSFERIMDPDVPAAAKPYFSDLDSIEVTDDYTVVLNYNEVFAPLLFGLARLECAIVPQEVVEQDDWKEQLIGTGPFKFESFVRDQAAVMVKNEDYWEPGLPKLDRVEQRVITDAETALVNVRTGDVHVSIVEPKDIPTLEAEEGVRAEIMSTANWPHLSVNCGREPFTDVRVRQAIRLGIDRETIHQLAFFGNGLISNTLLPEGNPFRHEVDGWDYDPDRARELLAEAGLEDGFSAVLRTMPTAYAVAAAQIIQENLAELNIEVEIEQIESTTWFTEVFNNSEFDITIVAHVSKVDPDLSMLDIMHSSDDFGTKNYTQLNDPEMDELLEAGRSTIDMDERIEIYAQAQEVFVERSGYIVLVLQDQVWAMQDEVQGFNLLPTAELRWKEAWLDG